MCVIHVLCSAINLSVNARVFERACAQNSGHEMILGGVRETWQVHAKHGILAIADLLLPLPLLPLPLLPSTTTKRSVSICKKIKNEMKKQSI